MVTDLKDAGFDERQSRGIVQAVVDVAASLGLFTSSEWRHWEKRYERDQQRNQERYEQDQELNQKQHDLALARIAALENTITDLKATADKTHLWIRWGLVIGFSWLSVLLIVIG